MPEPTTTPYVKRQGEAIADATRGFRVSQWLRGKGPKSERPSLADLQAEGFTIVASGLVEQLAEAEALLDRAADKIADAEATGIRVWQDDYDAYRAAHPVEDEWNVTYEGGDG